MKSTVIKYYSTNLNAPETSFREALMTGLAPDGGLYMPSSIPKVSKNELGSFFKADYPEVACIVLDKFLCNETNPDLLKSLCVDAYNFDIPVEKVTETDFVLRLDRGPSASFKDFAARMMARLMNHFTDGDNRRFTILTATSGDTGSAVANAFHGLEKIDVIILFPRGEVTETQRKQMTTLGGNIRVIAIDGKFDDCQKLVKEAFTDPSLHKLSLSSANSINIGRLLPQAVYYFYAWSRLAKNVTDKIVFSIPSGNFGNLMGAIIAREMGLPVSRLIIASNSNNEVPEYLRTGKYNIISPSINCISNAMNVGHPSNFARIIALYGGIMNEKGSILKEPDLGKMHSDFFATAISDNMTKETIREAYRKFGLVLEPHGATAWKAMEMYAEQIRKDKQDSYFHVSLETAHPAKFPEEVQNILGFSPELPDSLRLIQQKKENYTVLENNYGQIKAFINNL